MEVAEEAGHAAEGLHISLTQEPLGFLFGLPITASLITSWVVVGILLIGGFLIGRNLKLIPGKAQVALEELLSGLYKYVQDTLEDAKLAQTFFPLIATLFLFLVLANLLGQFPGMESIGLHNEEGKLIPFFFPINADLNIPLALAIISFLTIEISGIVYLGFFKYAGKFINFKSPIDFFIGILEIIGNLARLVSLSFRLFGNILAGHLLIIVLMFFAPYLLPLPFMGFEVFIAVMQAGIFALLTLFFIKLSIAEPHGDH